ncbi:Regulator of nonsense transcripts 3B [Hyphodiscus hymeniophilus]|uniref:Regulator of nonsense transcripts 3B n=1 Tax=Hyphodiscus hymeniophilus TaxID=353542 RepID=A0A9P6VPF1_9HELO|nr:Regulator of nonsense transcripts 3B [Hyphodiscus hymeniophilus]
MVANPGPKQANGVLPVSASQTSGNVVKLPPAKTVSQRLKVVIRRLAPGLTEEEFTTIIGEEWKAGQGKVDWLCYEPGKSSKNPSKPSRPSRAYIHLTAEAHLMTLAEVVRQSVFEDAQNTFADPALIGPPAVEFATYGRIPGGRRRTDARAGTIDQDPEFMSFLEALANPTTGRELTAETLAEVAAGKSEKVTTTPLVQFLKDKKASKSKDAAAKAAKKQESAKKASISPEDGKKKGKENKLVERAAKEAVKILNRDAASRTGAGPSTAGQLSGESATGPPKLDVSKVPGRQRSAIVAAHIRMLQRDLGLSPAQAHRQVRRDTADAQKAEKAAAAERTVSQAGEGSSSQAAQSPSIPTAPRGTPAATSRRARAKASSSTELEASKQSSMSSSASTAALTPTALLKKPETSQQPSGLFPTAATKSAPATAIRKPQVAVPSEGATQAFVKHANPSQGVTEPLLKEAMEAFGAVSMVEIDKRKGFAYVNFVDTEGLKKAMAANPIPVAQGTVQVMQRKGTSLPPEKKPQHQAPHVSNRGGRGGRGGTIGRRGGRGGGRGGSEVSQGGIAESSKAPASAPTGPAA